MNKCVAILNATVFCLLLQAADITEQFPLHICGAEGQKAALLAWGDVPNPKLCSLVIRSLKKEDSVVTSKGEASEQKNTFLPVAHPFYLALYPLGNPFIVFGQIQANSKSETGIISNLAIRKFVSGLLVLQCGSYNKNNLDFVQNKFLDNFTDAELLKGRIGSDSELKDLISNQVKKFTKGKGKEKCPISELESYVVAEHAEKVHCMLMWLSLQGDSYNRHEMHGFSINFEKIDDSSKQGVQQVQEEMEYLPVESSNRVVGAVGFDTAQMKENVKVDYAEPLNIVVQQCVEQLSNYVKPDYKQPYFLILDAKEALKDESASGERLRKLEDTLIVRSNEGEREETMIPIEYYVGLNNYGDVKLTEENVLSMLNDGMKIAEKKSE